MNMIRSIFIALSLLAVPTLAMAQEAPAKCETMAQIDTAVEELVRESGIPVEKVILEGDAFTAFLAALSNRFGPPPSPVESVAILQHGEQIMLVFFNKDGCAKFMAKVPESTLIGILREASAQ